MQKKPTFRHQYQQKLDKWLLLSASRDAAVEQIASEAALLSLNELSALHEELQKLEGEHRSLLAWDRCALELLHCHCAHLSLFFWSLSRIPARNLSATVSRQRVLETMPVHCLILSHEACHCNAGT